MCHSRERCAVRPGPVDITGPYPGLAADPRCESTPANSLIRKNGKRGQMVHRGGKRCGSAVNQRPGSVIAREPKPSGA